LTPIAVVLNKTVYLLEGAFRVLSQHILNLHVVKEFILGEPQNFESLFFGDETTLDSESLFRDLLSARVREFLHEHLVSLFGEVTHYAVKALRLSQGSNVSFVRVVVVEWYLDRMVVHVEEHIFETAVHRVITGAVFAFLASGVPILRLFELRYLFVGQITLHFLGLVSLLNFLRFA